MSEEMKTLICPGPPEHEFQIPKGRGRPPRFCDEHKQNSKQDETKEKNVSEGTRPAPRKRPGSNTEEEKPRQGPPRRAPRIPTSEKTKLDEPIPEDEQSGVATMTDEGLRKLPRPGTPDVGSRARAQTAADRAVAQQPEDAIPRGRKGRPMARIEFSASELIPTGQYANVSVGPARVVAWIDLDREVSDGDTYFTKQETENLVKALNELAEKVEYDVVAVQRNVVLENLQDDSRQNGNS